MNTFTLDGRSTSEWGIGLSAGGAYDAPARKGESISIPGSNRSVWVDGGGWENIFITFPCWIAEGFDSKVDEFRAFLSRHSDAFYKLTDTYHPDEYRMARYAGPFNAIPGTMNKSGRMDVMFECWPMRYFNEFATWIELSPESSWQGTPGEPQTCTPNWEATNPSDFNSYPIIKVAGEQIHLDPEVDGLTVSTATEDVSGVTAWLVGAVSGKIYFVDFENGVVRSSSTDTDDWETVPVDNSVSLQMHIIAAGDFTNTQDLEYSGGEFGIGVNQVFTMQDLTLLEILPRYATI